MHPHKKRCYFAGTFTFQIYAYMFLKVFLFQNSFTLQNGDIKDQQGNTRMVKTDRVEKMSHETLADEATCFFGALKTKRTKTIQTKMADIVQKEDQLRKCIFFKICKLSGGEGVRGRAPPLKDVTLKGMISEKDVASVEQSCWGEMRVKDISGVNILKNTNHVLQRNVL